MSACRLRLCLPILITGLLSPAAQSVSPPESEAVAPSVGLLEFTLIGGDQDDLLRGSAGNDTIYGGLGTDRIYGGDGADRFVFDIDARETDQILDFDPAEGDEIWIRVNPDSKTSSPVGLRPDRIDLYLTDAPADRVRVNRKGDVEVRFEDREWTKLVRTGRSKLDVKINREGDHLRLRFSQQF